MYDVIFKEFLKPIIKEICRQLLVKNEKNHLLKQYMKNYSNEEWICLKNTVDKVHNILNMLQAKTPEGNLVYTNPPNDIANITIIFDNNSFKLDCVSYTGNGDQKQINEFFNIGRFIKNCTLEKYTVEFDFLKNELRVPVGFDY